MDIRLSRLLVARALAIAGTAMLVTACGLATPGVRLPELDRQSELGLLDKQQRAAAIKSMKALAEEQKRRAAAIPKKPLPGEKLETPVRTVR